ncbi:hypothetical protein D3C84_917740 [compost metagenome]
MQARHRRRQFSAAPRRFTQPERDGRRLPLSVFDPDLAGFDAQDSIGRVAQLEDIAGDAFHRKVFVDGADVQPLGFQQHAVVGVVRNGSATGHSREFRASTTAQSAGHGVAMQVGAANTLPPVVALSEHLQQRLIMFVVEFGIRRSAAKHVQQRLLLPLLAADFGDDLLRQHVQRRFGN